PHRHHGRHSARHPRRDQHAAHRLRPPGRRRLVLSCSHAGATTNEHPPATREASTKMPDKSQLDAALAYADAHLDESLGRLKDLIRIKSISTDPAYTADV